MKLLELAVLESISGLQSVACVPPQRRSYLPNSLQPFYCRDAVLQHHCLKQVPEFELDHYFSFASEMEE